MYRKTPDADPCHIYHNVLVAIDCARQLNNGHPATLASCLDALRLAPGETFLHVGCGVGYYTAIAAAMVGDSGTVHAVEIDIDLAKRARQCLSAMSQVAVHCVDGASFEPGPCDAILVNAGFTHPLNHWLNALKPHGRLLMPITAAMPGNPIGSGGMILFTRAEDSFSARPVMPIGIFSSPTGRDDGLNASIRQALASGSWHRIKSLRRDEHEIAETCGVHTGVHCLSSMEAPKRTRLLHPEE